MDFKALLAEYSGIKNNFVEALKQESDRNSNIIITRRILDTLQMIALEKTDGERQQKILGMINAFLPLTSLPAPRPAVKKLAEGDYLLALEIRKRIPGNQFVKSVCADMGRCKARDFCGLNHGLTVKQLERLLVIARQAKAADIEGKISERLKTGAQNEPKK